LIVSERAVPDRASEIKRKLNDWLYALILAETLRVNGAVLPRWELRSGPCLLGVLVVL
jgi:hypothetical protein